MDTTTAPSTTSLIEGLATLTSSALEAISTSLSEGNGTIALPMDDTDEDPSPGNYVLNTILGLLIVLGASVLNALGLNITKLDHLQQQSVPRSQRRKEYLRPMWVLGMGVYIASQVFGSPLALRYLRPDWVAPLGASALIFNFLFAYWIVGTPVAQSDIRGTALIVLGVILIVVFSSINHGLSQSLPIKELNRLWSRGSWIAYFALLLIIIGGTYIVADLLSKVSRSRASFSPLPSPSLGLPTSSRAAPQNPVKKVITDMRVRWRTAQKAALIWLETMFARTDDARLQWLEGIAWAVAGGSLAGLCLVFTKAVVKIFWLPGHPLVHFTPILTLMLVIITAVLQIVCLNKALQCADTVVVVPLFYAGYTVFGFVNALIFYDQTGQYARWVLVAVFLSIAVLISGVASHATMTEADWQVLLSTKQTTSDPNTAETVGARSTDPAVQLRPQPQRARGQGGAVPKNEDTGNEGPGQDVLWEVGSVSDEEGEDKDEDTAGKGVGGTRDSQGERGGLLLLGDSDDEDAAKSPTVRKESQRLDRDGQDEEDEEDAFGEYAPVQEAPK